ncbi:Stp1/IreP family PP2C-type Ser/Thr phosphatase [Ammoniphilus resinae]|uniref:Protein phosphatase n=1 Tax=Ammoniphilus resinae TaxID=861532 RepID=A0ABS4GKE0_9BACL|nr:Stp1/IreP family PP2C-type Ser/Thr phosphatase [Ammoniphilus resinae]MBP1930725.1 protein phosphatase [Ammoniphilus resinae]
MEAAYQTHIGCVRAFNEDTGAVVQLENGYLIAIVADGMGGHQAGDVASLMAVDIIRMNISTLPDDLKPDEAIDLLDQAILKANDEIYRYAMGHDDCKGMGTTIAVCILSNDWIVTGHIGDSRIYRLSMGKLTQLTDDHSLVNELLKNGQISEEEAKKHPQKNVLTRALGTDLDVEVDLKVFEWEPQDQFLICTDGLSNKISSQQIQYTLASSPTPDMAVTALIKLALDAGGEDNITAVVINTPSSKEDSGSGVPE